MVFLCTPQSVSVLDYQMADRDLRSGFFPVWGQSSGIPSWNHSSTEKPQREPRDPQLPTHTHTHTHAKGAVTKGQHMWEAHTDLVCSLYQPVVAKIRGTVYLSVQKAGGFCYWVQRWGLDNIKNLQVYCQKSAIQLVPSWAQRERNFMMLLMCQAMLTHFLSFHDFIDEKPESWL